MVKGRARWSPCISLEVLQSLRPQYIKASLQWSSSLWISNKTYIILLSINCVVCSFLPMGSSCWSKPARCSSPSLPLESILAFEWAQVPVSLIVAHSSVALSLISWTSAHSLQLLALLKVRHQPLTAHFSLIRLLHWLALLPASHPFVVLPHLLSLPANLPR